MEEENTLSMEADSPLQHSAEQGFHYLITMSGPWLGEKYPIDQPRMIVGRDPGAEISIADPTVSRCHAELTKTHGKILIRDRSSRNGLFVNNLSVDEWVLRNGDLIRLGGTLLQFVEAENRRSFYVGKYRNGDAKQREHPRFALIAVGNGYLTREQRSIEIISIKDISRTGVGFFTRSRLEEGTEMEVAVYFKNQKGQIVFEKVVGAVAARTAWRGRSYLIAIRFHEKMTETNLPGLHARLSELEQIS